MQRCVVIRKALSPVVLAAVLALAGCITFAARAGSISQTLANTLGGWRTQDLKTLKVMPDPDCIADATVTDKTTCDTAVLLVGKMQIVAPGVCFPLDTNKAKTKDSYQVTPSSPTSTSRPIYDINQYLSAGTLKEIGRAPNGTICTGNLINPAKQYRTVAVNGISGMSLCGLVVGKVLLDKHELRGFGDEMVRFERPQDKWCDDYIAGTPATPAPAPTPAPVTTLGTTFCLLSDDNAELSIDSKSIVASGANAQACSSLVVLTPGAHTVVVKFIEFTLGAQLHVWANGVPIAANWSCSYFNNTTFSGTPALMRTETVLDFNWKLGSPDPSIAVDNWSAVCSGTLNVQ
jgi:hypothetical protein